MRGAGPIGPPLIVRPPLPLPPPEADPVPVPDGGGGDAAAAPAADSAGFGRGHAKCLLSISIPANCGKRPDIGVPLMGWPGTGTAGFDKSFDAERMRAFCILHARRELVFSGEELINFGGGGVVDDSLGLELVGDLR